MSRMCDLKVEKLIADQRLQSESGRDVDFDNKGRKLVAELQKWLF